MKQNKKLKIALLVLIIFLISVISFGGIYVENKGKMENVVPEYKLARDLKGYRRVELIAANEDSTSSDVENTEEANKENKIDYSLTKKVIEKRLENMNVYDYIIRHNSEDGKVVLELPENEDTDRVVTNLYQQGKFEVLDNDTQEVLMTNDDIEKVESGYATTNSGLTVIIVNIEFNNAGKEKLKDISTKYTTVEEKITDENGQEKTEEVEKKISLQLDGSTLITRSFDEKITNGIIQLQFTNSGNSTVEELQEQYIQANSLSAVMNSGKLPTSYTVNQNKYIYSDISTDVVKIVPIVMLAVAIIATIALAIKYKVKGLLGGISLIGFVATYLVAIRYTNVEVSIGGFAIMAFAELVNILFIYNMLKKEIVMDAIKEFALILVPALIISVVFTLSNLTVGAMLFWAVVITLLYNLVITKSIIK